MKVVFNVNLAANVIADTMYVLAEKKKNDYYEHVGHAMAARKEKWEQPDHPMFSLMKEIHGDEFIRHRPGYFVKGNAVSYSTSNGNTVWFKVLEHNKVEIGYNGARHGMSHMFRIVDDSTMTLLESIKPVHYETSEKGWLWHETRDDAIERLTGKSLREWEDVPVNARGARLSQMNVTKRMTDIILSL